MHTHCQACPQAQWIQVRSLPTPLLSFTLLTLSPLLQPHADAAVLASDTCRHTLPRVAPAVLLVAQAVAPALTPWQLQQHPLPAHSPSTSVLLCVQHTSGHRQWAS